MFYWLPQSVKENVTSTWVRAIKSYTALKKTLLLTSINSETWVAVQERQKSILYIVTSRSSKLRQRLQWLNSTLENSSINLIYNLRGICNYTLWLHCISLHQLKSNYFGLRLGINCMEVLHFRQNRGYSNVTQTQSIFCHKLFLLHKVLSEIYFRFQEEVYLLTHLRTNQI